MRGKIIIEGIAYYHPKKKVTNDFFYQHFNEQGKDVTHLFEDILGRKERYVIDNENRTKEESENTLTMQISATRKVLEKCSLYGKEIDGIIVTSQLNEYIAPPSAVLIHKAIGGNEHCFCYDINVNCVGMLVALQQAAQYIQSDTNIKHILIVAGDSVNSYIDKQDERLYGEFGDSACAMIVSSTNTESAIIDTDFFIHYERLDCLVFPKHGMSNVFRNGIQEFMVEQVGNPESDLQLIAERIRKLLERNYLSLDQITVFCFSQFAQANIRKLCELLQIPETKCPYVGAKYGYTLSSSPIMALESWIEMDKIKRGDYILLWTVGVGEQNTILLMKY